LSAPDGGPLSRTVKLLVVPLVLRPSAHPWLAATVLDDAHVAMVDALVADHGDQLRAAAAWFVVLVDQLAAWPKGQVSRDSCYPRAFELAVCHGAPDPGTAAALAHETLAEVAEARGQWTPAALREVLADPDLRATLSERLAVGWASGNADNRRAVQTTRVAPGPEDDPLANHPTPAPQPQAPTHALGDPRAGTGLDQCTSFLDTFVADGQLVGARLRTAEQAWTAVVACEVGWVTGWGLREDTWPTTLPAPARARRLGLTDAEAPPRPALDRAGADEARCPWDRSIGERVAAIVTHSADRTALPGIVELLTDEVDRACAPWEVASEAGRAMLVLGTVLVTGLVCAEATVTQAHQVVLAMRRRESWLAWAQRQPAPTAADDGLIALADEASDPVAPYLRRLWVRVHGAETRGTLPVGAAEVQNVLVGVFRSVLLDGRSRVRAALTRLQGDLR